MKCPKCDQPGDTFGIWNGRFMCMDCYRKMEAAYDAAADRLESRLAQA